MNIVSLSDGTRVPALGIGTWRMGETPRSRAAEVAAVALAIELGIRVIDTAEMYGDGGAEEVVGAAVAQALGAGAVTREALYVVSKVYPHHASRRGVEEACRRSLKRLGLGRIDLYLLHWPGSHPLRETVAGFEALRAEGLIGRWGVSNFDLARMNELAALEHGPKCASNQVAYSLSERGPGFDLLPWQQARSMPLMAYGPLGQGELAREPVLRQIGERHRCTGAQIALAWLLAQPGVIAIPKALREAHLRANVAAADIVLTAQDLAEIDRQFPPPDRPEPLAMV